jgi:hypothetical protein
MPYGAGRRHEFDGSGANARRTEHDQSTLSASRRPVTERPAVSSNPFYEA